MRVLAIDTALGACAAAVLDTDRGGVIAAESLRMTRGHAEALMPLIARVLANANLSAIEMDRIAVTVGPGSFTGLRVGISAARGMALAISKPAVGLTTLAAFAAPYINADDTSPLIAAIDARNNNVFIQLFGSGGRSQVSPRLATLSDAIRVATNGPARVVGSAADKIVAAWPVDEALPSVVEAQSAPDIEWVARLGVTAPADGSALPKPLYLRAPDAQPQDAARLPRR
jgi:tRNA threonylcarbamoyladenosine biosynthesis protein TsaB